MNGNKAGPDDGPPLEGPLLLTKLFVPRLRADRVLRPRLLARLNQGLAGIPAGGSKLTLVSAPAGFGKTTLVSEWLQQAPWPFAWLSLDPGDDDLARFLAYLVAALQRVNGGWGGAVQAALGAPEPPAGVFLIQTLINEIARDGTAFVLALDDYQVISQPAIHQAMALLVDTMPPSMHLVLITRADPPFPLARLRARGHLSELRADDLRLTREETADLIHQGAGIRLTAEQAASLDARVEGWAAGLQLAALSLQHSDDVAGFIDTFAGSHRYVMDYLIEEVFNRQPPDVQAFLLQTCILDRLSGPLCDALTGQSGGREMLDKLDRANLFTVPLDHARRWYRYHHLFADLLRDRLQGVRPEWVPLLHSRASAWYQAAGLADEAFRHALAAEDLERAVRLAEDHASRMIRRGELATLLNWLQALPEEVVHALPRLCLHYGWALLFASGRPELIEPHLQAAERALARPAPPPAGEEGREAALLLSEATLIRLCCSRFEKRYDWSFEMGQHLLTGLAEDDQVAQGLVHLNLGINYRRQGNLLEAAQSLSQALKLCQAAGHTTGATMAAFFLARVYEIQGQLHRAAETCQRALRAAASESRQSSGHAPGVALVYAGMADVLYEWDQLEEADWHLQQALKLGESGGNLDLLVNIHVLRARLRQARGFAEGARQAMDKANQLVVRLQAARPAAEMVAVYQARLWLAQGQLSAAARWAETVATAVEDRSDTLHGFQLVTLAQVRLAQGRLAEAASLLDQQLAVAETSQRTRHLITTLALQALVRQAQGDQAGALAALERAVTLAEPEGYVRSLVDVGGPALAGLLKRVGARGPASNHVARLLAAVGQPAAPPLLAEPLTQREFEVLYLVATGLRNQEIADQLVISLPTVKRHITNIHGKLAVSHRTQAVARARELGLLPLPIQAPTARGNAWKAI